MSTAPDAATETLPVGVSLVPALTLLGQADAGGRCEGDSCGI